MQYSRARLSHCGVTWAGCFFCPINVTIFLGLGGRLVEPGTLGKKLRFCGIGECVNCDKWWRPVGRLRVSTGKHPLPCWSEEEEEETETTSPWSLTLWHNIHGGHAYRGSAESAMHGCHVTPNPPAYQAVEMRILYMYAAEAAPGY